MNSGQGADKEKQTAGIKIRSFCRHKYRSKQSVGSERDEKSNRICIILDGSGNVLDAAAFEYGMGSHSYSCFPHIGI